MGDLDALVRDLRKFEGRKELTKQLRKQLRAPVPAVRKAIRARAMTTMPRSGGLNKWVAATRVTAGVKLAGRGAGVTLKGSRKSTKGKADLRRLDAGRIRHPSWGRRGRSDWHTQSVPPGYFTSPAAEVEQWRAAAVRAVDDALATIQRG